MAVVKVFDSVGVKTLSLMGNADEQPYDEPSDEEINEHAEETDDGF
jgi:hypothetical protein